MVINSMLSECVAGTRRTSCIFEGPNSDNPEQIVRPVRDDELTRDSPSLVRVNRGTRRVAEPRFQGRSGKGEYPQGSPQKTEYIKHQLSSSTSNTGRWLVVAARIILEWPIHVNGEKTQQTFRSVVLHPESP